MGHLGKSFHVVADNLRIWTLQLADDFEALVELGEDVHHRAGEQSVLRCDLELESQKKRARKPERKKALETGGRGVYLYREHVHLTLLQQPARAVK